MQFQDATGVGISLNVTQEVVKLDGTTERYGLADVNLAAQSGEAQHVFLPLVTR